MFSRIAVILAWLRRIAASQADLLIENLALRQQLAILTTKRPRPRMRAVDRFFWLTLRRLWPRWKEALVVIRPDTVVRWHRAGSEVLDLQVSSPRQRTPLDKSRNPSPGPAYGGREPDLGCAAHPR